MSLTIQISDELKSLIVEARETKSKKTINSLSLALMTQLDELEERKKSEYSKLPSSLIEIVIKARETKSSDNLDILARELYSFRSAAPLVSAELSLHSNSSRLDNIDVDSIKKPLVRQGASSNTLLFEEDDKLEPLSELTEYFEIKEKTRQALEANDLEEIKEMLLYLASSGRKRPELNAASQEEVALAQALNYLTADSHPLYSEDFTCKMFKARSTWFRISIRPLKALLIAEDKASRFAGRDELF